MLEETFSAMDKVFKVAEQEISDALKSIESMVNSKKFRKGQTKIKIGKGSTVIINGAKAQLLHDTFILTDDPNTLMCKKNDKKKEKS
jgi:hypothetical protein